MEYWEKMRRMGTRTTSALTALVLLLAWMAAASVSVSSAKGFMLEVPALYLSVGQEFQPRLLSLAANAAAPASSVSLELFNPRGTAVATQRLQLDAAAIVLGSALALPSAGSYVLRAYSDGGTQSIALHALPEPAAGYGGVLAIASLGLSAGAADYLRQHGFAVTELDAEPSSRLIVVGDPRLDGANLPARYTRLWRAVAGGASLLLLDPIPPGVAGFWPLAGPLAPGSASCGEDAFATPFTDGMDGANAATLLQPPLAFDLAQQSQLDLYHWDGRRLLRPDHHRGYAGCHALFSFRLGSGWVTYSTLPLLQHFQDARARIYLMNLIEAMARRKRYVPDSPGLAWVMTQRMQQAAREPVSAAAAMAVFYRPPPASAAPAPRLEPGCAAAAETLPGASWTLNLAAPQAVRALKLDLRPAPGAGSYALAASLDGQHWTAFPGPAVPAGSWKMIRLSVPMGTSAPDWQFCGFGPVF